MCVYVVCVYLMCVYVVWVYLMCVYVVCVYLMCVYVVCVYLKCVYVVCVYVSTFCGCARDWEQKPERRQGRVLKLQASFAKEPY